MSKKKKTGVDSWKKRNRNIREIVKDYQNCPLSLKSFYNH